MPKLASLANLLFMKKLLNADYNLLNSQATAFFIYNRTRCCRCVQCAAIRKSKKVLASARVVPAPGYMPVLSHSEVSVHIKCQSRWVAIFSNRTLGVW